MSNVTSGKPNVAGGIWRAPINTTLPTDSKTKLDDAFVSVGYITEDGVNLTNDFSKEVVKAWGGDIVMTSTNEKGYGLEFSMMESLASEPNKIVYGDDNVTSTANDTVIEATGDVGKQSVYVIERVTDEGKADRIVIPCADITAIGAVSFKDSEAVVYPVTLKMIKTLVGGKGVYFKEYIEK